MARKNITAQVVRTWLTSEAGQTALKSAGVETKVGTRGRHNPAQVKVFKKHNPRLTYNEGVAEAPTVTVKVPSKDSRGRNITKKVTLTNAEARAALGHATSRKGPIPLGALAEALASQEA